MVVPEDRRPIVEDEADRPGIQKDVKPASSENLLEALPETTVLTLPILLMTMIATVVALVGLFNNNVAVIVGAMVVSPLLTPITGFILELSLGRPHRALANLKVLIVLIVLVVALSAMITAILYTMGPISMTPQILDRFERRESYLLMAVLLGFAAIIAQVRGFHESLVGIGISLSLLPPAVVAGIAFALFRTNAVSALALSFDNIIGVMIGGFLGIFFFKIGPAGWERKKKARAILLRAFVVLVALLLLLFLNLRVMA
ncbi:MAG TPA: TIGR00341 family protein [Methanoregulaceae archaeon]|nr:TIGR00341 family protein [Methanoregulaceae archaeon]HQJ87347.1 TIGR00341 family protein [Methanoregulaceae archaeon]